MPAASWNDLSTELAPGSAKSKHAPDMERAATDESVLLQRIRDGALDDFAEIVQRHQSRVFAILSRYERDAHRVEDMAQETFIKAWRSLQQFDGRAPFEHWLSRIAVRVAIDHLRARRHREVRFTDLGDAAWDWLQQTDPQYAPDSHDAREILELAMQKLNPEDRLVITMLEIEEYSVKEICARTGWSSVVVRVRAFRARAKLREALTEMERQKSP